jgi:pimeloyl-ACP methyl ester carboxylesterase
MKINEMGQGRHVLVLHGGGGLFTVMVLAQHLANTSHVIAPTYPGWDGTPRPDALDSVGKLADECLRYLEQQDLKDVVVVGNSIGGWLGAELALRDEARRLSGLVIINGLGVNVPGLPITNVTGFTPPELAKVAYHDPTKFLAGLPPPSPERLLQMKANQATLAVFAGTTTYCYDPTLLGRLQGIRTPTLLLWGEADRIATTEYARAYAAAIPAAQLATIANAGHLPWTEQPEATFRLLDHFVDQASPRGD